MTQDIFSSASKLVLLALVATLVILALVAGIHSVLTGTFNDAEKAILTAFTAALTFVFGFYFNAKGDPTLPNAGK
jgi:uncharacterized membrane protein YozB (DUF420 family)